MYVLVFVLRDVFPSNCVCCDAVHVRCCAPGFCIISKFSEGLEGGVLIPHSRPFFARIPHPARFSSVSRIPLFFPTKIH